MNGYFARLGMGSPSWIAGAVYVMVGFWLWPRTVMLRNDEFAYLESVVNTVRRGWPASSEWLGPYDLVLPLLSLSSWSVSGNFYASTYGLMALFAVACFILAWCWSREWLPCGWTGNLAFLGVVLSPVWLNKMVEFSGVSLGLVCFLSALIAWSRQRVVWFFLFVLVGIANRQSMICMFALPAVDLCRAWWTGKALDQLKVWACVVSFALAGALFAGQPDNFARQLVWQQHVHRTWLQIGLQQLLGLVLMGGGAAFWSLMRGEAYFRRPDMVAGLALAFWLLLGVILMRSPSALVHSEIPFFERYNVMVVLFSVMLCAMAPLALVRVAPEAIAVVVVYIGLVSGRGMWWDYYLLEPMLLLGWCRLPAGLMPAQAFSRTLTLFLLAISVSGMVLMYHRNRSIELSVDAYERNLRAGVITMEKASGAPFGYLGWKLAPLLYEEIPRVSGLSDFLKFVEDRQSYYLEGKLVLYKSFGPPQSIHPTGEIWRLPGSYRPRPFPLNNDEWREFLQGKP